MLGFLTLVAVAIAFYNLKYVYRLVKNYRDARRTGVPYIIIPINQNHMVWMVISVMLRPLLKRVLPVAVFTRFRYAIYGWEFSSKLQPLHALTKHRGEKSASYEKSFILVTCGTFEFITSDIHLVQQILSQPGNFQQNALNELFIGMFGPNVLCTDNDVWSRHRKVTASAVTERISPVVWAETIRQTKGLINEITSGSEHNQGQTRRFFDMLKSVTIHVLSKAGMGVEKNWDSEATTAATKTDKPSDGSDISYMDSVKLLNDNMTGPIIMPNKLLLNWPSFMPGHNNLRRLGFAKELFPVRTKEMVAEEKVRLEGSGSATQTSKANLLSMLVAASNDSEEAKDLASGRKKPALSDDELISNLYVFTSAGYDTTANTISFAATLLMRYPKWQDWLIEETDQLLGKNVDATITDYQAIFPHATRTLATMFETLRFFTPLVHLAKGTKTPQSLTTASGRQFTIPGGANVYINTVALHLDASVWRDLNPSSSSEDGKDWEDDMPGRDAAVQADIELGGGRLGDEWRFRPSRWINSDGTLFQPPKGSYIPWSIGPRVCPGQRMAQVEFTAILLTILSKYRIEAVPFEGESRRSMNERLDSMMQSSISKLAIEMNVYNQSDEVDEKATGKDLDASNGLKVKLVPR